MFEQVVVAPPDPILGLTEAYRNDARSEKINLGVGVYQDEQGRTPVLQCVKRAEQLLWQAEQGKEYLGIGGDPQFGLQMQRLVFGDVASAETCTTVQAPGGTGALRVAGDFLHQQFPQSALWLSQPTWANHGAIFSAAGMTTREYAYLNGSCQAVDFDALCADLRKASRGDVVLLHGCCHNPSGVDLSVQQWSELAKLVNAQRLLPLVDLAYQGFGRGLEEDVEGLRTLAREVPELLVAASGSKNFGLYRERVGSLTALVRTPGQLPAVASRLKVAIRSNYSNPPAHGAAVVQKVLSDVELRALWVRELDAMRTRIHTMRNHFADAMQAATQSDRFEFIRRQSGMFSFSGLSPEQVDRLRSDHAIYMVRSGRMNVAGMSEASMPRLAAAVAQVL